MAGPLFCEPTNVNGISVNLLPAPSTGTKSSTRSYFVFVRRTSLFSARFRPVDAALEFEHANCAFDLAEAVEHAMLSASTTSDSFAWRPIFVVRQLMMDNAG
jgi:hypothetical protein